MFRCDECGETEEDCPCQNVNEEENEILIGKVIRLYSKLEPSKVSLYLITDDEYNYYSHGKVTLRTALSWVQQGLDVKIYSS